MRHLKTGLDRATASGETSPSLVRNSFQSAAHIRDSAFFAHSVTCAMSHALF